MNIIDTHSHLFAEEFQEDLEQTIERAKANGISKIFMPNIDSTSLSSLKSVCNQYPDYCFPMIGLHPTSVTSENLSSELEIVKRELDSSYPYVAVGEIGIDLYWEDKYLSEQIQAFEQQVKWAIEYNLPTIIHCRNAFDEIHEVLSKFPKEELRGIFHSFTGEANQVDRMLEFPNFLVGVNGISTFKKSTIPAVLPSIPLDRIVLETDSPYLAPVPYRGKRNESSYVTYVLQKIALIYNKSIHEVSEITTKNALKMFEFLK